MGFIKCKDCPDRSVEPNCHMICEHYLNYVEENNRRKDKIYKAKRIVYGLDNFRKDQIRKSVRK